MKNSITAEQIAREYARGVRYKEGIGRHGLFRQNEINERFYIGDQWHGAGCGEDRPLVRQNIIKRIADYKMSVVNPDAVAVTYTAQGIAESEQSRKALDIWRAGDADDTCDSETKAARTAAALSDHFAATSERLKFHDLAQKVMQDAYITGTGILYTYWDDRLDTGLFADTARQYPIRGDIVSEVLHIDQVFLGDPAEETLQAQPYLLIAQQKEVETLKRTARRYGGNGWKNIRPDNTYPADEDAPKKATVVTRFWKEWDENGDCRVWGMQVAGGAVVRPPWCLGIRLYPLADFRWCTRHGCGYGESEIPYLIPNQIAINRMLTAGVWAMMMTGMPIMLVNGDVVTQPVTNDPGQVIPVYGNGEDVERAIKYVDPPAYSSQYSAGISSLITDTLNQAGVSGVVLGDVRPDNASAILAVRDASVKPMQLIRNRFFSFCEDVARIWADFWVQMYGRRPLRLSTALGSRYCVFDADDCNALLFTVKVDVAESVTGDQNTTLGLLNKMLEDGVITPEQYVSRLPAGSIPGQRRLLRELRENTKETKGEDQ